MSAPRKSKRNIFSLDDSVASQHSDSLCEASNSIIPTLATEENIIE